MGTFALLLRYLTWWQAAACAVAALLFNAFLLPRLGGRSLFRPADAARGIPPGILFYPLSVLLLILALPARLDIVAGAWAILACGDGSATLVGLRFGRHPLPWNRDKTMEGAIAFALFGTIGAVLLIAWTAPAVDPSPPRVFILMAPLIAAVVAALVETIPIRFDDNLSTPAVAAVTMWALSLATPDSAIAGLQAAGASLVVAVIINAMASFAGWRAGTVRAGGAIVGALLGIVVYVGTGLFGWLLLLTTFLVAAIATRVGLKRKALLGIAEERGGRRGGGNALANCGVAMCAASIALFTPYQAPALLAFVASLAAGGSDTVASEIGKAWGARAFLVTGFGRVRPGTPGAVSLEGTAAGLVAALALAALAVALRLIPGSLVPVVVVGATIGSLVESALGATLEAPGIVNNDVLNFINTAVAAVAALGLARALS
jgi:uncharacterized protein (TIGR00297 family)